MINLTLSLHHRGSSKVSPLQFLSLYICSLWLSVPVRIHTGGFHRFTKIVQIFHNKYIFSKNFLKNFKNSPSWNLENGLDSQNISCLNDSETQEKGFWGVKILKISRVSMPPDLPKSRKPVSIYCRSTAWCPLTDERNWSWFKKAIKLLNEPRLRKVKLMISSAGDIYIKTHSFPSTV